MSMGISPINTYGTNPYALYGLSPIERIEGVKGVEKAEEVGKSEEDTKKVGRKSTPAECQTCKERRYQDGSDENVSFKSAQHISPTQAGAAVKAHEGEHVANAYKKAAEKGGQVMRASVAIHMSICPECGRSYVSGGTTSTAIKYPNEKNPYQQDRKAQQGQAFRGMNFDVQT